MEYLSNPCQSSNPQEAVLIRINNYGRIFNCSVKYCSPDILFEVAVARAIAREVRAASGGLKGVKAIGVLVHGRAQLAMNITDFEATPVSEVHRKVASLAARHKTAIAKGELIGLIPEAACEREGDWMRQLDGFDEETKILERRLEHPLAWPEKRSRQE